MVLCRPRSEQIYRRSLVERIPVDRTFHDPPLKIRVCFSLPTHTAGHVPHVSTFRIGSLHICLYFFDFPLTISSVCSDGVCIGLKLCVASLLLHSKFALPADIHSQQDVSVMNADG